MLLSKIRLSNFTAIVIFLILITGFSINYTTHSYVLFSIIFFVGFIQLMKEKKFIRTNIDFLVFLFIFIWFYGLMLGIVNNNNTQYMIANFAGLILYASYFVITNLKIKKVLIIRILIYTSVINILGSIGYSIYQVFYNANIFLSSMTTGQIRFFYFQNMGTYYITLVYTFFIIFAPQKYKTKSCYKEIVFFNMPISVLLFLLSLLVVLLSASKGYILGLVIVLIASFFLLYKNYLFNSKINIKLFYFFSLMLAVIGLMLYFDYDRLFLMIFSYNDVGNSIRYEQFYLLFNDLTLFGKGLGAEVINNDTGNTYGFELSYINIIHKFGILSALLFFAYLSTVYLIFKKFKKNNLYSLISLASIGYLFPSIGNPILYAPINVMLHVLALSILNTKDESNV